MPEQIIKQTVDTKPEENIGIRREDEFVKNKLPKPEYCSTQVPSWAAEMCCDLGKAFEIVPSDILPVLLN